MRQAMKRMKFYTRIIGRFARDEAGSILIMFGLGVTFLVAIAGAGIDLGMQQLRTIQLQQTTDTAAISAGTMTDKNGNPITQKQMTDSATRYYNLNYLALGNSGVLAPSVLQVTTDGSGNGVLEVQTQTESRSTSFINNSGILKLDSQGYSKVAASLSQLSDYDVAMIVDESGSEAQTDVGGGTREQAQQAALRNMIGSILPPTTPNPNVRMGFIGFSGEITNRWGLSSDNAQALDVVKLLRPIDQNFDHTALLAAKDMLSGGTKGTKNETIGGGFGDKVVDNNTQMPVARTARTNPSDTNGLSPLKYAIFLSDGGIMYEPADDGSPDQDKTGLVHKHCPGRQGVYHGHWAGNECFDAFLDACQQLKTLKDNPQTTDSQVVHLIIINLKNAISATELSTLTKCASPSLPDAEKFDASQKPDPTKDFFYAKDAATEEAILKSVTQQIKKTRIVK
jgi:Flp pilus assembly protein TadG